MDSKFLAGAAAATGLCAVIMSWHTKAVQKRLQEKIDASNASVAAIKGLIEEQNHLAANPDASRLETPAWDVRPVVKAGELVVFNHAICPFGQRAWLAAHEVCGAGGYRLVNIDLKSKPIWYKDVYEPQTVPSMQYGPDFTLGDSIPVCQWINTNCNRTNHLLYPSDEAKKTIDELMGQLGGKLVGPLYGLLRNKDEGKDAEMLAKVNAGMVWFDGVLKDAKPFFLGSHFSMFEVLSAPFFIRFQHTLKYYRGVDIYDSAPNVRAWMNTVGQHPSVVATSRPGMYYVQLYQSYAGARRVVKQ